MAPRLSGVPTRVDEAIAAIHKSAEECSVETLEKKKPLAALVNELRKMRKEVLRDFGGYNSSNSGGGSGGADDDDDDDDDDRSTDSGLSGGGSAQPALAAPSLGCRRF